MLSSFPLPSALVAPWHPTWQGRAMALAQRRPPQLCSCGSTMFSKARATASSVAGVLHQPSSLSALLELRWGGEKKSASGEGKAFRVFCGNFVLSACEFCRRRGGSAAVSRAVSPLCEELWRLWPACFLAYFGIVHVECDTPDFPGCLSNASHLYQ